MKRKHTELKFKKQYQEFTEKFLKAIYHQKHRDIAEEILCKFYLLTKNIYCA